MNNPTPLKKKRYKLGLSLSQAAELFEMTRCSYARVERDGSTTKQTAAKIAKEWEMDERKILYPERYM